jgi:adenine-specific DNA-methyltransferase
VPDRLFNPRELRGLLKSVKDSDNTYYWAILQNLFFATLNQEADKRQFCDNTKFRKGYNPNRLSTNLYRHQDLFRAEDEAEILALFRDIPFLNGGLFECLDEEVKRDGKTLVQRVDGFSRNPKEAAQVPNQLFFQEETLTVDLNATYDTKGKGYKVRGLLHILNSYKFTVTENTPIEEEIALDPELLGKVFENLLAAYNPETQTTARKKTGSFYTPREVVDYMVDESLVTYFETALTPTPLPEGEGLSGSLLPEGEGLGMREKLRRLVSFASEENPFAGTPENVLLIKAINELKALDPAVGSGAFPMGMLQKLVMILRKLDPDNRIWEVEQRERLIGEKEREIRKNVAIAQQISDVEVRDTAIAQLQERLARLEAEFATQDMDYTRKLFLIENCIYGVDIQNIAVQIAKLRCFIALIVEQTVDDSQPNRGIFPLPNLEMKFVAANTLFALEKAEQLSLLGGSIELKEKETELEQLRHDYFQTYDLGKKRRLKEKDEALRAEIATLLQSQNVSKSSAEKIAYWKPYDQLAEADFFDPHWMFGIEDGFDIVVGNPPYVRMEQVDKSWKPYFKKAYECHGGRVDLYVYFFERALKLLKPDGVLTYICSNKYFRANYGEKLRNLLSQKTRIQTLIDFGDAPVFTAIAYPSIIITQQSRPNDNAIAAMNWETERPVEEFVEVFDTHKFDLAQTYLGKDGWQLESPAVFNLLEKLRAAGKPLGEYVNGRFYYGIKTGYNQAFVVDRSTRDELVSADPSSSEVIKPFARGRDIKRWRVNFAQQYLIFMHRGISLKKYPAIKAYLEPHKNRLERNRP